MCDVTYLYSFITNHVQISVSFRSSVAMFLAMQLSDYSNPTSLQFPSAHYSEQAIDCSAPASRQDDDDDVLDLRIRPRNETIVKEECYNLSCPCTSVSRDPPSPSMSDHYVSCPHTASHADAVNAYTQPPNTVLQASQPTSPPLFSSAFVVPSSSVISVQSTAAPATSGESLQIPFCPQYTCYRHTPSAESLSHLQVASSSENSLTDTASVPTLSPTPSVGTVLPRFQLLPSETNFMHFARPSSVVENQAKKHKRPFKAMSLNLTHASTVNDENFKVYRQQMLEHLKAEKKSSDNKKIHCGTKRPSSSQPSSSSSPSEVNPADAKDAAYLEKRKKNNAAAKRSRDARRAKEDELAIWAAFLERENAVLKYLLAQCTHCRLRVVNNM